MAEKKTKSATKRGRPPKKPKGPEFFCLSCGKSSKEGRFYTSRSPRYKFLEKLPWCFDCVKEKYDEYYAKYEDSKRAMYDLCKYLDVPFSVVVYEAAKNRNEQGNVEVFQGYLTHFNSVAWKNVGVKFEDGDKIREINDSGNGEYVEPDVDEDLMLKWGKSYNPSDYEYLEREYAECTKSYKCDNWAEKKLLKEICIKSLELEKMRNSGNTDTKDVLAEMQKLMKTCAIDPAKVSAANSGKALDTFGEWIKDIEQNEPAEWYENKEKYKDMDGFDDYLKKYILRPIKNFITGSRDFSVDKEDLINLDEDGDA